MNTTATTDQGAQAPTTPQHGGRRSYQPGRPRKRPTRLVRVAIGTDEQRAAIDAMTPDERLAKLTKGE